MNIVYHFSDSAAVGRLHWLLSVGFQVSSTDLDFCCLIPGFVVRPLDLSSSLWIFSLELISKLFKGGQFISPVAVRRPLVRMRYEECRERTLGGESECP